MSDPVDAVVDQWRSQRPDLDPTPLLVVGRVQRLASRWEPLLRPPFAAAGLANGDFDLLAALRRADRRLSPGELAGIMLVTPGAATKRVDRLIVAGLVTRSLSAQDGRGRLVALTAKGRRLTDRLISRHFANEATLLSDLTLNERSVLAGLLSRLLQRVEPDGDSTHHEYAAHLGRAGR